MSRLREQLALATAQILAHTYRRSDIRLGEGVMAFGLPLITAVAGARVVIGRGVRLVSVDRATPLGVNHRVIIRALHPGASIIIGDKTGISGGTICSYGSVSIGERCLLGANVTVFDTDFHPVHDLLRVSAAVPEPAARDAVIIGDNVFIGTGAIIVKGVHIGDNSVIGAGAVVTSSCPANTIMAGNPARVVGSIGPLLAEGSINGPVPGSGP
ncbi:MAG: acyltransferase [Actinomycetota bacterium]|nr:acyltransferase [Actinomycetota bacterium]